ncbi:MAG: aquaporin [Pseudomonadota bacterium]
MIAGGDIGLTGISFAFAPALMGMACGIGPVSGCHVNPAVSLGMVAAGHMTIAEATPHMIAQVAGSIVAALILMMIASGKADYSIAENGLGQNGWGSGYLGEYSMISAFIFEVVATFLFWVVILGATGANAPAAIAGLAIGFTLVVIDLVGIKVTGVSVNPARSIGPAFSVCGGAIPQLWMFIIAPVIGAVAAGAFLPPACSSPRPTKLRTPKGALTQIPHRVAEVGTHESGWMRSGPEARFEFTALSTR